MDNVGVSQRNSFWCGDGSSSACCCSSSVVCIDSIYSL